jgi:O-acetyl-ADP-ribose deacetylase
LFTLDYRGTRISLLEGDIVDQDTEAIVNAANSSLMGGGGVDGAIHRAGGPAILHECLEIRRNEWPDGLSVGEAVITTGGNLRAKYVIHTVGPIWNGGSSREEERLAACHENSLHVAIHNNLKSIAFPAISTGAYGYPVTLASKTALNSVRRTLDSFAKQNLEEVRFVLFTSGDYDTYISAAKSALG